jgi:glycosidase
MTNWIQFPLVYQLDARLWLAQHSRKIGRPITLAEVPEAELERWSNCHFDAVWLMGVWQSGERSRSLALNNRRLNDQWKSAVPDWKAADVASSPFSIADYRVAESLGGEAALAELRKRLTQRGIKLILDFVPNHTAPEHPWVKTNREFYIAIPEDRLEQMNQGAYWSTDDGTHLACGRDPNFPAWSDTLQLNFANVDLCRTLIEVLHQIAGKCDGVRCDMAMLMVKDVFNQTWGALAGEMRAEFWDQAIADVKKTAPDFLFVAEAYWRTEWHLQQLGFDFAYDKHLYDKIVWHDIAGAKAHLGTDWEFARRLVRFTENHDESRAANAFGSNNKAASLLTLTLPGLRLIHEGQPAGLRLKLSLYLLRWPDEEPDCDAATFYERLLEVINNPAITRGKFHLLELKGDGAEEVIAFERRCGDEGRIIAAANLSDRSSEVSFSTDAFPQLNDYRQMQIVSTELARTPQLDLWGGGVTLRLRAHEGLLLVMRE